jgi:predicted nucleic acid-binding protein
MRYSGMRAYLDNVAASGRVVGDLTPVSEMEALQDIERAASAGLLKMVTSRESWREQERTQDPLKRAKLEAARSEVLAVATDHVVLGFSNLSGPYGTISTNPIVTDIVDEALFADLKSAGLDDSDARHLMYAVANACDRFVTLDPDFLGRRVSLEARCQPLRILRPSELVAELRSDPRWDQLTW